MPVRLALLTLLAMLLAGCNRNATPTPLPPSPTTATILATPLVTATDAVSVANTPPMTATTPVTQPSSVQVGAAGTTYTSARFGYSLILPCCWLALPTPSATADAALDDLADALDAAGELPTGLHPATLAKVLELVAILPSEGGGTMPRAQLTVSVLPTTDFTLDDYLAATTAELVNIATTQVQDTRIDMTLGPGGMPAARIEYTVARSLGDNAGEASSSSDIAGLQVAFFGADAEQLIVLTFTTAADQFASLQAEFARIVRLVDLSSPA